MRLYLSFVLLLYYCTILGLDKLPPGHLGQ